MTDLPGLAPDYVFNLCKMVLKAMYDYWPSSLAPLPAKNFVAFGTVFFETPCVACGAGRIYSIDGDVSLEQRNQQYQLARHAATIEVSIMRFVPDMVTGVGGRVTLPGAEKQEEAAKGLYAEGVTMWNVIQAAHQQQGLGTINGVAFQDRTPVGPEGGIGGNLLTFLAALV